jgi:hypothetical protein
MPDFNITPAVVKRIADIWGRHGKQLNEETTEAFPDNPDKAFVVIIGFAVGATRVRSAIPTNEQTWSTASTPWRATPDMH